MEYAGHAPLQQRNDGVVRPSTNDAEWKYRAIIAASFLIHIIFAVIMMRTDITMLKPPTVEELPQRLIKIIMDKPKKPEVKVAEKAAAKEEALAPEVKAEKKEQEKQVRRQEGQKNVAAKAQRVQQQMRTTGMLALLAGKGPTRSRSRAVVDVLGGQGVQTADLDDALKNVTGLRKAGNASDMEMKLSTKVVSTKENISIADMVKGLDGGSMKSLEKLGSIEIAKPKTVGQASSSSLRDDKSISDVVKKNMKSVTLAYNRALKANPSLGGKIVVKFTIQPDGSVTDVEIAQSTMNDSSFEQDVLRRVKNWTFPAIAESEGSVTVNFPFIFQSQG
ncbi:MAG: hypothetical protein A2350_02275 [Candidatus Raymondbacteria bacterium RifOxyB12_full_50_8]|nr:MAG: hypothetical protein A2350_02275 [Candidatus Raymondbacteria bacterium RifOxyB12_full_50_8]